MDYFTDLYDDFTLAQVIASGAVTDHAVDTLAEACPWLRAVFVVPLPDGTVRASGEYHGHTFAGVGPVAALAEAFGEQRRRIAHPWLCKLMGR